MSSQVRSEFDQLLMNHARTSGASVYELTKVKAVSFSATDPTRPISVDWTHTSPPSPLSPPASPTTSKASFGTKKPPSADETTSIIGTTTFTYLIDATGRAGIMSTKYLKNRHFNVSLKNVAVWGYWNDVRCYGVGTSREGAPWFEALTGAYPSFSQSTSNLRFPGYSQMNPVGRGLFPFIMGLHPLALSWIRQNIMKALSCLFHHRPSHYPPLPIPPNPL